MSRLLIAVVLALSSASHAGGPKKPTAPKAAPVSPCLSAPVPKGAPALEVDGASSPLPYATMAPAGRSGDGSMAFRLRFASEDGFGASRKAMLNLRLKKGEVLAGRTFEQKPDADMKDQPDVIATESSWTPRVSAVEIDSEPEHIQYEHGVASTVRVVFGKQAGDKVTGTVQLCIEPGQRDDFFQKTPTKRVRVLGTFEVDVSELKMP